MNRVCCRLISLCLILVSYTWLLSIERDTPTRLIHSFSHSEFQDYSDSTSIYYNYRYDNPLLLSSVQSTYIMHNYPSYMYSYSNMNFINSLEYVDDNMQIDYTDWGLYVEGTLVDTIYTQRVSYILDNQGRTIYYHKDNWNDTNQSYDLSFIQYRHYNARGYVDSMYVANQLQRGYFKRVFENNRLLSTTVYTSSNNVWTPLRRYTYNYITYPNYFLAFVRFDNYTTQTGENAFNWEALFNPKCQTSSITLEDWINNSWVPNIHYHYTVSVDQYCHITLNRIEGSTTSKIIADQHGNIYEKSSDESGLLKHINFTWDTTTANDDNVVTPIDNSLTIYPNPFNPTTTIAFCVPKAKQVVIRIYNIKGQLIKELIKHNYHPGKYTAVWDGKNDSGSDVVSGMYLVKMDSNGKSSTNKVILLK